MSEDNQRQERRPIVSGFVWLGIGLYLQLMFLDLLPSPEKSWPAIIIIIGIAMIVGAIFRKPQSTSHSQDTGKVHR